MKRSSSLRARTRAARAEALTVASEQRAGAVGFNALSKKELEEMNRLNRRYATSFGFPCIVARSGFHADRRSVVTEMKRRLANDRRYRTAQLARADRPHHSRSGWRDLQWGKLTTHVLDYGERQARRRDRHRMWRCWQAGSWKALKTVKTNADGRTDAPVLEGEQLPRRPPTSSCSMSAVLQGQGFPGSRARSFVIMDPDRALPCAAVCSPWGYTHLQRELAHDNALARYCSGPCLLRTPQTLQAQHAWPAKPVRVIVTFPTAASSDIGGAAPRRARSNRELASDHRRQPTCCAGGTIRPLEADAPRPTAIRCCSRTVAPISISPRDGRTSPRYDPVKSLRMCRTSASVANVFVVIRRCPDAQVAARARHLDQQQPHPVNYCVPAASALSGHISARR